MYFLKLKCTSSRLSSKLHIQNCKLQSITYLFYLFQPAVYQSDSIVIVWQAVIAVVGILCKKKKQTIDTVQFIDTVNCLQAI